MKRYYYTIIFASIITLSIGILFYFISLALCASLGLSGGILTAVSIGLSLSMSLAVFAFLTRRYRLRKKLLGIEFPCQWRDILCEYVDYYNALPEDEKELFEKRVQLFIGEKIITGIEYLVDDRIRVLVASSAVIPVFRFPEWEYDNIAEVLIYPKLFSDDFSFEGNGNISGMVFSNTSTVIISGPQLIDGFRNRDGMNVGIHEFIHKIDAGDGDIDGIPALLTDRKTVESFKEELTSEIERIRTGDSDINPYAMTNFAEGFAVVSEYFFEKPQVMKVKHPGLYDIMKKIFRIDGIAFLADSMGNMIGRKKGIGRNDPCPCGSGKKYKKCCLKRRGETKDDEKKKENP